MELHTTGNTLPGVNKDVVLERLQHHLKLNESQAQALLQRKLIIKRNIDKNLAHRYYDNFRKLGLDVLIKESTSSKKSLTDSEPSADIGPSAGAKPSGNIKPSADTKSSSELKPSTEKETLNSESLSTPKERQIPQTATKNDTQKVAPFPVSMRDFEEIFTEEINRPKVGISYKLGLVGVALFTLLTPIFYLSLIGMVGWGTITYLFAAIEWVSSMSGILSKIVILSTPTFIGIVLFLFLVKPLFAKREEEWGFDLQREDAPALFNLIDVMCARINIHSPKTIRIDNTVNAAAGPDKGIISLLRGDMKLYIGLPLLAGMSARQFVGVLAHEFGHFAQPVGMMTYQLINRVNHWLYDRAFIYDHWDQRLANWMRSSYTPLFLNVAIWVAQKTIKLTRFMFHKMYLFNHRLTQNMSRQMEYDADCYESMVCGSQSFKETSLNLRKLSIAASKVYEINDKAWNENRLLCDYAAAIAEQSTNLSDKELQQIEEQMHENSTTTWDSHPADTDRITHVESRNDGGFFFRVESARNFCKNFTNLSERVTRYQYTVAQVTNVDKYITDNSNILKRHEKRSESQQSLSTYFANLVSDNQILRMDANIAPIMADSNWQADWQQTIDNLRQGLPKSESLNKELDNKVLNLCKQKVGLALIGSGIDIPHEDFSFTEDNTEEQHANLSAEIKLAQQTLAQSVDLLFHQRIKYALYAAKNMESIEPDELKQFQSNYIFVNTMSNLHISMKSQYRNAWVTNELLEIGNANDDLQPKIQPWIKQNMETTLKENLNQQWQFSAKLPDHVDNPDASLLDYIESVSGRQVNNVDVLSTPELVDKVYQVAGPIAYQYSIVLGDLADTCLKIEKAHGIKPIKLV